MFVEVDIPFSRVLLFFLLLCLYIYICLYSHFSSHENFNKMFHYKKHIQNYDLIPRKNIYPPLYTKAASEKKIFENKKFFTMAAKIT